MFEKLLEKPFNELSYFKKASLCLFHGPTSNSACEGKKTHAFKAIPMYELTGEWLVEFEASKKRKIFNQCFKKKFIQRDSTRKKCKRINRKFCFFFDFIWATGTLFDFDAAIWICKLELHSLIHWSLSNAVYGHLSVAWYVNERKSKRRNLSIDVDHIHKHARTHLCIDRWIDR